MAGALKPIPEFVHLLFVFLLGFAERFFLSREGREIKRSSFDLWPIQHHRHTFLQEHFIDCPAGEVNR